MAELDFNKELEKEKKVNEEKGIKKHLHDLKNINKKFKIKDLDFLNTVVKALIVILLIYIYLFRVYSVELQQLLYHINEIVLNKFFNFYSTLIITCMILVIILYLLPATGRHRFGGQFAEPKKSFFAWVCQIFAAGIGGNFVYFAYYEPFYFFDTPYFKGGTELQRSIATSAFNRGLNVWLFYCIAGLPLCYYHHTKKLPLLPRTYLYPLLKDKIYGVAGDIVDIIVAFAIFLSVASYFDIMTLTALEVTQGRVGSSYSTVIQTFVVVLMGIFFVEIFRRGLQDKESRLPQTIILLMSVSLILYLAIGPTKDIIFNFFASLSLYVKYATVTLINLEEYNRTFKTIVADHTIYNIAYWCTSSMCLSIYFAKISYGRTIRDFILASLVIPFIYIVAVYTVFGTIGLNTVIEGNYDIADFTSSIESGLININTFYLGHEILSILIIGLALFIALGFIFSELTGSLVSASLIIESKENNNIHIKKTMLSFSISLIMIIILYFVSSSQVYDNILNMQIIYSVLIGCILVLFMFMFLYEAIKDILYFNIYLTKLGYKEKELKCIDSEKKEKIGTNFKYQPHLIQDIDEIEFTEEDNILNIDVGKRHKEISNLNKKEK